MKRLVVGRLSNCLQLSQLASFLLRALIKAAGPDTVKRAVVPSPRCQRIAGHIDSDLRIGCKTCIAGLHRLHCVPTDAGRGEGGGLFSRQLCAVAAYQAGADWLEAGWLHRARKQDQGLIGVAII